MDNGTRILFALPALISGILVLWLVLAARGMVAGPRDLLAHLHDLGISITRGNLQNWGLKI